VPFDFNADAKSDLLLQNAPSVGTPDVRIELLNGKTVGSSVTITTPVGWTVQASGDFNQDNKADIILQTADGTPQIWLMNGTSVTSTVTLPNSGTSWHAIGTSDFNGDGKSDIIWQNDDGPPFIWEMNGTSMIGAFGRPNPGPTWHIQDEGPIRSDPAGAGAQTPALQLSSPDPAGAGAHPPALHLSTPDAANAAPMLSASGGTTAPAAGIGSSDPSWVHHLHAGTT
jgi:hypothetical protein